MKDYKHLNDYKQVMERADRMRLIREVIAASFIAAGFAFLGVVVMAAF